MCYVDVNHAVNILNRKSNQRILIYVNNTPVVWYYKRQNTLELPSFGSEFLAFRIATDLVEYLRYKLLCFGVPLDGPSNIFCDKKSVVKNVSMITSMLNNRHNAIFQNRLQEAEAEGKLRVVCIPGERNLVGLLTKNTTDDNVRHSILEVISQNK